MKQNTSRFALITCILFVSCNRHDFTTQTADPTTEEPKTTVSENPAEPEAASNKKTSACPTDMVEISGNFCPKLEHLCLEGYAKATSEKWTKCPAGCLGIEYCESYMVGHAVCRAPEEAMHYCVDKYEYRDPGEELPKTMVSWLEAGKLCEAQGKRLCLSNEWSLACEGDLRRPYTYGWARDETKCNLGKKTNANINRIHSKDPAVSLAERTEHELRRPPGSFPECVSPYGVYDMAGNVDEWTDDPSGSMTSEPYRSALMGGHMLGRIRGRCRPKTTAHNPPFASWVQGFRCCKNAK